MLLYIHVPFCVSRCKYCAFHSLPVGKNDTGMINEYLDALLMEIALYGEKFPGTRIQSIFFGGGTPSLLPPKAIAVIMDRIAKAFKIAPKPEITLEANPETLKGGSVMYDLLDSGINRLSLGAQSLDDNMLRMLGRPHKAQDAINAIMGAKAAGFGNVSVDLMWGLPNQSIRQWLQTLKEITQLGVEHISSYGLTLEPGTTMEKECSEGRLMLPPERDQALMFMEGAALLESRGFIQYEISNFARMGYQSRHNMGYWEGADYLGLGPSSTSTVGNVRWTNPANMETWKTLADNRKLAENKEILTPRTRLLELVMLRLRTARGLRLKAYRDMTGRDFIKDHKKIVQAMYDNGLVKILNGYLSLTRSGMLVSNAVIGNLFERINESLDKAPGENLKHGGMPLSPPDANIVPRPIIWPMAEENKQP